MKKSMQILKIYQKTKKLMFNKIGGKMKRLVKFSILFSTLLLGNSVFAQDQGEETVVQEKLILTVEDADCRWVH